MRRSIVLACLLGLCACDAPNARAPVARSHIPKGLPMRAWPPESWAWGLIRVRDAPALRYGVAAPSGVARGQVLILPDYAEPAEAWFEAAQGLIDQGYQVWTLDLAGQAGSGRYTWQRDVGHAPDFKADVDGLKVMRAVMDRRPMVLVAQGQAAPIALDAVRAGLPVQGMVLSAPVLTPAFAGPDIYDVESAAPFMEMAHLGWIRAWGQGGWSAQSASPLLRSGAPGAWQAANPALRMGGPSFGYIAAFMDETAVAKAGSLARVAAPALILHPGAAPAVDAAALCRRLPHCTLQAIPEGRSTLHLESAETLAAWTSAVTAFIDRTTPKAP